MNYDVLFFQGEFLLAKPSGWQWGPGEDGTNGDTRFALVREVDFDTDGEPVMVGGVRLALVDGDVIRV